MSDAGNVEVTLTVQNNTEVELGDVADTYAADQAREYKNKAGEYAENALNSQNMAEAWAESDSPPAGEGTRSSKVWADTARQWAESDTNPDGIANARSSKTWAATARAWAESTGNPDGIAGAKSAKTWAEASSKSAAGASASAKAADTSAKASASSAAAAKASQEGAATQATNAGKSAANAAASAKAAADKYTALVNNDLPKKANLSGADFTGKVTFPTAPTGTNNTQGATTAFVAAAITAAIQSVLNGTPETLDTLNELAAALGNDPNFAATITNLISTKLDKNGTAVKATSDAAGNNIQETYATKTEMAQAASDAQSGALSNQVQADWNVTDTNSKAFVKNKPAVYPKAAKVESEAPVDTPTDLVYAKCGTSDRFRIRVGGAENAGWVELATGDDNAEPIYVRQYKWNTSDSQKDNYFGALVREAVLLDASGNTSFPGTITATKVYNAVYNDYAEFFPRGGDTQRGDIIALDETTNKEQYVKATAGSLCVVGVHTEDFASIIGGRTLSPGDDILKVNLPTYIPVALAGRVPVRMYGKAKKGGWVIPSEMPGVGRMALSGESLTQAVGQIVKDDTAENVRLVKIIVRSGR